MAFSGGSPGMGIPGVALGWCSGACMARAREGRALLGTHATGKLGGGPTRPMARAQV